MLESESTAEVVGRVFLNPKDVLGEDVKLIYDVVNVV